MKEPQLCLTIYSPPAALATGFSRQNTGEVIHASVREFSWTQGWNPHLLHPLHGQVVLITSTPGKPKYIIT